MAFVTDTHPLVYFEAGRHKKLSRKVLRVFREAEAGLELVFVPTIIFREIEVLRRKRKVQIREGTLTSWARRLFEYPGFLAQDLTLEIVLESVALTGLSDPMDSLIVATARCLELPLITKDTGIIESRLVPTFW